MDFFRKYPFLSIVVIIVSALFIYGMLLSSEVLKASNSVNINNDPGTVGVATAVQDLKTRFMNYLEGISDRDYTIDYMPTEYVPDEELAKKYESSDKDEDDELTDEEKVDRVLNGGMNEQDAMAAARRAERSERMKNGEADEILRESFKTKLADNDASFPGDAYDGFYAVQDGYFTGGDTVIIGDSREQGFGMYSGLSGIVSYAVKSYGIHQVFTKKWIESEHGKLTLEEAMAANQGVFKKVYIKFGLNEMGWADEATFDNAYYQLIDMIKYYQPDAVIYIQSIINVTRSKSEESSVFNNTNINARNEALKVIAEKEHVAYLDLNSVLADSEGFLPEDFASDGIHIKQKYMYLWVDFLKSHAVIGNGVNADYIDNGESGYTPSEEAGDETGEGTGEEAVEEVVEEAVPEETEETGAAEGGETVTDESGGAPAEGSGDTPAEAPATETTEGGDGAAEITDGSWETGSDLAQ